MARFTLPYPINLQPLICDSWNRSTGSSSNSSVVWSPNLRLLLCWSLGGESAVHDISKQLSVQSSGFFHSSATLRWSRSGKRKSSGDGSYKWSSGRSEWVLLSRRVSTESTELYLLEGREKFRRLEMKLGGEYEMSVTYVYMYKYLSLIHSFQCGDFYVRVVALSLNTGKL